MTAPYIPQLRLYQDWLRTQRGLVFDDYDALWRWSTTDLDAFWQSIWDYFAIQSPTPHSAVLAQNTMPGAQWFPGAQVNYARQVLRHVDAAHAAGFPAIVSSNEKRQHREMTWPELRRQVASLALHLQAQGVEPGDRVAAYLPNVPETMVAFLATVSIGAVWSLCAPDMGTNAVLDRFRQIEPKVLIAVDGVGYGGRDHDRLGVLAELRAQLPSVQHTLLLGNLNATVSVAGCAIWAMATGQNDYETDAFEPLWLPFDNPLWIVYSSGTTGLPKPIVHGHGGILVEHVKTMALIKAGKPAGDVVRDYEAFVEKRGFKKYMLYGPCHGIGMMEVERPWMESVSTYELQENMTFQVDTFFYDKTFGLRWENGVRVTRTGVEKLSKKYMKLVQL